MINKDMEPTVRKAILARAINTAYSKASGHAIIAVMEGQFRRRGFLFCGGQFWARHESKVVFQSEASDPLPSNRSFPGG